MSTMYYRCGCLAYRTRSGRDIEIAIYEIDWQTEEREHMFYEHGWSKPSWLPADAITTAEAARRRHIATVHGDEPEPLPFPTYRIPPEPPW